MWEKIHSMGDRAEYLGWECATIFNVYFKFKFYIHLIKNEKKIKTFIIIKKSHKHQGYKFRKHYKLFKKLINVEVSPRIICTRFQGEGKSGLKINRRKNISLKN